MEKDPRWETYLGDGLYAEFDGLQIRLYASNGIETTNEVFMDSLVLPAFEEWIARLRAPK